MIEVIYKHETVFVFFQVIKKNSINKYLQSFKTGGDGGSRTLVQYPIHINLYECSLLLEYPLNSSK